MRLSQLPQFQRFLAAKDAKVLRHKGRKEKDLWLLRRNGEFQKYQNGQSWDVFGKARYVISFIAERHRYAKFVGVWEVQKKAKKAPRGYRYTTRELSGFKNLESRLIINWGDGARSWAQWLHRKGDKEIVELLPPNYVMDFPGFYNFTLTYAQVREMVRYPDSNREWQRMLASVSGIYVILDTVSGKQYIGSAYGVDGFWSRWRAYANSPGGGNKLLKDVLAKHPGRENRFQFSVLKVFEPGLNKEEVLEHEALMKRKLGSRAFGLNGN